MGYTWQGKFIFNLGKHPRPSPLKLGDTMKTDDSDFNVSTSKYVSPLDATLGDMPMHLPKPKREGYSEGSEPRVDPTFPFPRTDPRFPKKDPRYPFPRPGPTFPRKKPTFPFPGEDPIHPLWEPDTSPMRGSGDKKSKGGSSKPP